MFKVNIYLETSVRGLKRTVGWYGYLVEYIDGKGQKHIREDYGVEMAVTPNMTILTAFIASLGQLARASEITVFTDNAYLRESYEKRLPCWRENGWKTAHGEPIKNQKLWQMVAEKTSMHIVRFDSEYHHEYKTKMAAELVNRRMGNA